MNTEKTVEEQFLERFSEDNRWKEIAIFGLLTDSEQMPNTSGALNIQRLYTRLALPNDVLSFILSLYTGLIGELIEDLDDLHIKECPECGHDMNVHNDSIDDLITKYSSLLEKGEQEV